MQWNHRYLWGTVIVIIVFLGFNAFLITTSYSTDFDLVDENYYDEELNYQTKIEALSRTKNLPERITLIDYQPDYLIIQIPVEWIEFIQSGDIYFYRPSNAELDRKYSLTVEQNGEQKVIIDNFALGKWRVAVEWTMRNQEYIQEFILTIR